MKEGEMAEITRLIRECLAGGKEVRGEANRLRERFQSVRFSFDELLKDISSPNIL
jgi:hypothetical protein